MSRFGYSLFTLALLACRVEGETKYVPDRDSDGINEETDCDDTDASVGEATTYFFDADRDGHGDPANAENFCEQPEGYALTGEDCDDQNAAVYPGAEDICDDLDNDCDGTVDNGLLSSPYYTDADNDGYGDDSTEIWDCVQPAGTVPDAGDCNDADGAYHPGAPEEDCEDPNDYNCDGSVGFADNDGDGFAACSECDDTNAAIRPDAAEVCDGADNDCDALVDDEDPTVDLGSGTVVYADFDFDGYGDAASPAQVCEIGPGQVENADDCDDLNPAVNPAAAEICNGIDDECDGLVDDADDSLDLGTGSTWYTDSDGDGYGDDALTSQACEQPTGASALAGDCDDTSADWNPAAVESDCTDPNDYNCDGSVGYTDADGDGYAACSECDDASAANYPGAVENCDGADNDCDGTVDEDDAADALTWYADGDGDGYGDATATTASCAAPAGYVADTTDCDDSAATVHPGAREFCNGVDDDCDGSVDDSAVDALDWYADTDGDGYGDAAAASAACDAPAGSVADASDCDDGDADVSPGADEYCDGIDNDCDISVDEDSAVDASTWFADGDADGYGDAARTTDACAEPAGYAALSTDCNDAAPSVNPGASETCNGTDDDCDGVIDDSPIDEATWYADDDSDGYGDATTSTLSCDAPAGYVADATDCNDAAASINPAATETCDRKDNDCDGTVDDGVTTTWYRDADLDGYGVSSPTTDSCTEPAGYADNDDDCDDTDASAYPGGTEVDDLADNDCDGTVDESWWVGTGADGALSVAAGSTLTLSAGNPVTGFSGADVTVTGLVTVVAGDEVLILNTHGSDGRHSNVGVYEFLEVASVSGQTITLTSAPSVTFGETSNNALAGQDIQLVKVWQYTDVTLGASSTLTTEAWDGSAGGVVAFRATGAVSLASDARISVDELGFAGGTTGTAYNNDAFQGESYAGEGDGDLPPDGTGYYGNYAAGWYLANYGGGGAMITGGGGNHAGGATAGDEWYPGVYPEAAAGDTYGETDLATMFLGSGGAGVWYGASSPGSGGNGAGIIFIAAETVDITSDGSITAIGGTTSAWATGTWTYGAGGGAGGTIWVMATTIDAPEAAFDATGGFGESTHTRVGGDGGYGRIRLEYDEINGLEEARVAADIQAELVSEPDAGYTSAP
jgi:hypothetical protein